MVLIGACAALAAACQSSAKESACTAITINATRDSVNDALGLARCQRINRDLIECDYLREPCSDEQDSDCYCRVIFDADFWRVTGRQWTCAFCSGFD
ncbi:MAG: hypothetical protein H6707_00650 [Deltaproteobacteria bacterium]|nr:hypothetical protein [Deltaproteobacteria bacterium]